MKTQSLLCRSLLMLPVAAGLATSASAATFVVTNTANSGVGSLRAAINAASQTVARDTITFQLPASQQVDGLWTIKLRSSLTVLNYPVDIKGPGSNKLRLQYAVDPANYGAVFNVQRVEEVPESETFSFSGMALRNCNGVSVINAQANFDDVRFTNNGIGGIHLIASKANVNNCDFYGNSNTIQHGNINPGATGSAIRSYESDLIVRNSYFENNGQLPIRGIPAYGGAIYSDKSVSIHNSKFVGNYSQIGNAVHIAGRMNPETKQTLPGEGYFYKCLFKDNYEIGTRALGDVRGGTVSLQNAFARIDSCTFRGNKSVTGGGVCTISSSPRSQARVENSLFVGNQADRGGAIFNHGGAISVLNSTFSLNKTTRGAAIHSYWRTSEADIPGLNLFNCTLDRNSAAGGASEVQVNAGAVELLNTILRTVPGGVSVRGIEQGGVISSGGNLATDDGGDRLNHETDQTNVDPMLDPKGLQNNGGPTMTIALATGSPAIGAGLDAVLEHVNTDQRGAGFPRKSGNGVDVGAFEVQQTSGLGRSGQAF